MVKVSSHFSFSPSPCSYLLTMLDGAWCWICLRILRASESLRVWYHNDNITLPLIYQISWVKRKLPCFIIEKKAVFFFFPLGTCYALVGFSLKAGLHLPTFCTRYKYSIPCLEESLAKFRRRLIHLALSGMVLVLAQKPSGINSNVDIKAKLTPSAGQVARIRCSNYPARKCVWVYVFEHSISIYSHFKNNFMLERTKWSCFLTHLARWFLVFCCGCFHDSLIIIEESACGWFVSTMSICCSSPNSDWRKERQTVVDFYWEKSRPFAFSLQIRCLSRNKRQYSIKAQGRLQLF